MAFIEARVVDGSGQLVPDAGSDLVVSVDGPGEVVGMDNGYQADLEAFRGGMHRAYNGMCLIVVKGKESRQAPCPGEWKGT
ncbi:hypothetical protein ACQ86N_33415 [Puia sp. P3]|uniref:hypothetical protein n=1 Tax=Puia sp. P3 TaxID=3423952 RepID=UPI003D6796C0